jgi:hypothetical protein
MSWISVRDRLPEENQHVFVWIENPYTDDDGNKIFGLHCIDGVTHWQKIEPPKGEDTNE